MKRLYWQDMPAEPDMAWFSQNHEWYMQRIARCESVILQDILQRAVLGHASILDLGFTTASHRRHFIESFAARGILIETHYLNVDSDQRWLRIQQRNASTGETFVMTVDRQMFDYMEKMFEPPVSSEGAVVREVGANPQEEVNSLKLVRMTQSEFADWIVRSKANYAADKAKSNQWSLDEATQAAERGSGGLEGHHFR